MTTTLKQIDSEIARLELRIQGLQFQRQVASSADLDAIANGGGAEFSLLCALACKALALSAQELVSKCRTPRLVLARFIVWHLLHKHLGLPSNAVAQPFNRDDSTIRFGISRARDLINIGDRQFTANHAFVENLFLSQRKQAAH